MTNRDEERLKALDCLFQGSFGFELNMNDTFGYGCADGVYMDSGDAAYMLPVIAKYGLDALTAYGVIRGCGLKGQPIKELCTDEYHKAREEIIELMKKHKYFIDGIILSPDDEEGRACNFYG